MPKPSAAEVANIDLFDDDGYPTDEFLDAVKNWECGKNDYKELMEFIKSGWHFAEWGFHCNDATDTLDDEVFEYRVSTGGWSGNEDLIAAMRANFMFWSICWVQARRGGHYIFHVKKV